MMKDDDFKLLRGFDYGQTDEQTFVIVESLSRLTKITLVALYLIFKPYSRENHWIGYNKIIIWIMKENLI